MKKIVVKVIQEFEKLCVHDDDVGPVMSAMVYTATHETHTPTRESLTVEVKDE